MNKRNGLIALAVAAALSAPAHAAELTFSGAVEVEAAVAEDYAGAKTTDIVVATAAVGMDAVINDRVSATLAFLYEEDDTDFGLDEGYLTMKMTNTASLVTGRIYVPFGNFESNMVSDPMTLELGETSETAIMLSMESGGVSGSLYTFNGDADDQDATGDNDELSFGASAGFANDNMGIGASYISNIADSDMLEATGNPVAAEVPGVGAHFSMNINSFSLIAEYLAAAEEFAVGDELGTADGGTTILGAPITPSASNVEVAFALNNGMTIAAAYQMTQEAVVLGLPESRASAALSFEVMDGASVGIEYATSTDYEVADGGTGETDSTATVQLAVEF